MLSQKTKYALRALVFLAGRTENPSAVRSFFQTVNRVPFWGQTLLGLLVGAVLGLVARQWDVAWLKETLTQVGSVFVSLLRTAVGGFAVATGSFE